MGSPSSLIDRIGGRKFVLTLLVLAIGTAAQILSPNGINEAYVALLLGAVAAYGAANAAVTRKAIDIEGATTTAEIDAQRSKDSGPVAPLDLGPLEARLEELAATQAQLGQGLANVMQSAQVTNNLLRAAMKQ